MRSVRLADGTRVYCLRKFEALAIDQHVGGYFQHGIAVHPGDVVLDVGANIGLFALRLAQRCELDVAVFASEPIPEIREVLRKNLERLGSSRLKVLAYGLGRERGTATFTYFENGPGLSTALPEIWDSHPEQLEKAIAGGVRHPPVWWGRLVPPAVAPWMARRLLEKRKTVTCELRTVSDVIAEHGLERVDLLKVDIEGGELDVLRGIDEQDWPKIRQVVLEVHNVRGRLEQVQSLLAAHGLSRQIAEQESGFRGTWLYNVFARRISGGHVG